MPGNLRRFIKRFTAQCGIGVTSADRLAFLEEAAPDGPELLRTFADSLGVKECGTSQLGQDLVALLHSGAKRGGFFVEFGATDGISLSNTLLLEKKFGWTGILAEPARCWHAALKENRTAVIDTDCVWSSTGSMLQFNMPSAGELSTIASFSDCDSHGHERQRGETFDVRTVSLVDLLDRHHAPKHIDYLSIDTEGSEFAILNAFDFNRYRFGLITCEHNYTPERQKLHSLLSAHGYTRKFTTLSKWDDWYFGSKPATP